VEFLGFKKKVFTQFLQKMNSKPRQKTEIKTFEGETHEVVMLETPLKKNVRKMKTCCLERPRRVKTSEGQKSPLPGYKNVIIMETLSLGKKSGNPVLG
jgi:hypothetical protein